MTCAGGRLGRPWAALTAACVAAACGGEARPDGRTVELLYAGSLSAFVQETLGPAFTAATGIELRGEPAGSVAGARMIADGIRSPDVYWTADPATLPLLGSAWEGWAIAFARGEMTIGYTERSRFRPALDSAAAGRLGWIDVVARPGFRFGRTDPELDPKGYRTLWMFELASRLRARALPNSPLLRDPDLVFPEAHLATRLEAGQLDAAAFYLSEARSHGFRTIRLPPEVHQGDPRLASLYAGLRYRTREGRELRGSPILYCAAILTGARSRASAEVLLSYLLGAEGRELLRKAGLQPYAEPLGDENALPPALRARIGEATR